MSRPSLARRLPLAMAGVAALGVLIAALVAWPLFTRAAEAASRATLARVGASSLFNASSMIWRASRSPRRRKSRAAL